MRILQVFHNNITAALWKRYYKYQGKDGANYILPPSYSLNKRCGFYIALKIDIGILS